MSKLREGNDNDSHLAGLVSHVGEDRDSDSAGLPPAKHQTAAVRLTLPDGVHGIEYGMLDGHPWMNPEATLIEFPFHGSYRSGGGPSGWESGMWLAVIEGKRLERIHAHISEHRRVSVNCTGSVMDGRPEVGSIEVRKLELPEE